MAGMTRAFRDLWLKLCTDGSYEKASSVLVEPNDPKMRCCLGVAYAAGQELGLILSGPIYNSNGHDEALLRDADADVLGIMDQQEFADANDYNATPSGQFYPTEVLDKIREHPVID